MCHNKKANNRQSAMLDYTPAMENNKNLLDALNLYFERECSHLPGHIYIDPLTLTHCTDEGKWVARFFARTVLCEDEGYVNNPSTANTLGRFDDAGVTVSLYANPDAREFISGLKTDISCARYGFVRVDIYDTPDLIIPCKWWIDEETHLARFHLAGGYYTIGDMSERVLLNIRYSLKRLDKSRTTTLAEFKEKALERANPGTVDDILCDINSGLNIALEMARELTNIYVLLEKYVGADGRYHYVFPGGCGSILLPNEAQREHTEMEVIGSVFSSLTTTKLFRALTDQLYGSRVNEADANETSLILSAVYPSLEVDYMYNVITVCDTCSGDVGSGFASNDELLTRLDNIADGARHLQYAVDHSIGGVLAAIDLVPEMTATLSILKLTSWYKDLLLSMKEVFYADMSKEMNDEIH